MGTGIEENQLPTALDRIAGLVGPDSPFWSAALTRLTYDFYHLPAYVVLCALMEGAQATAYLEIENDFVFLWPLLLSSIEGARGYFHAGSPYGYPGLIVSREALPEQVEGALARMRSALAAQNVLSLFSRQHPLLSPQIEWPEKQGLLVPHGQTVSIDLSVPLEDSYAAMRSTHKRHISRARKGRYQLHFSWDKLPEYQRCYKETMDRVGAAERYYFGPEYLRGLRDALGSSLNLITLEVEGQIACGGLFVETSGLIQYHLGGTRDDYLQDSPAKLLFDEVRIWGKSRGCHTLHLGGGVGAQADALFDFKAGFSDRRHNFHTFRGVTDAAAFQATCATLGQVPRLDGYFPPFSLVHPPPTSGVMLAGKA